MPAVHVRSGLAQPGFGPALLLVGEALGLLGAVRADVAGAVTETDAVAVGLDAYGLAGGAGLALVPAVLDVSSHQAASSRREETQARTSSGS
ncbi:hypothetical protein SFR_5421 [Streptomyces sp. FR-008]|nr:hypothetical protein SFR_5421 [Streptomyces sp. FR-008]